MSLASILAVACALLAPGPWALAAHPAFQAQEQPQESPPAPSFPVQTAPAEPSPPKSDTKTSAPAKKTTAGKSLPKKKPYTKKKKRRAKVAAPKPDGPADKRVVRNGSATDPTTQISPSVPPQKASSQMQNTNELLNAAEANLKSISRTPLNASQEDMVKQIKTYMDQAKTAVGAGDLERANNLATKAQLLSAELVKK